MREVSIAVIPARGGSKRIPRKNVRMFRGKPMIAWTVEAALASNCFSRVIVSTDDAEIAEVAKRCGAEVPFVRPQRLADDHTGTTPVVAHALRELALSGDLDFACCLYATAPFLCPEDIRCGRALIAETEADYAFAVTRFRYPIQRALRIGTDGHVSMFQPEHFDTRSQDLEEAWHDAGQFYWGRVDAWLAGRRVFSSGVPVVLPGHRVQDIDTEEDWRMAEIMHEVLEASELGSERARGGAAESER